jgi:hypothetical protein
MRFTSTLDEFRHWYGMLAVDLALGVPQRHLNCTVRLCGILLERVEKERLEGEKNGAPLLSEEEFTVLSFQLLDLQRQMQPKKPGPKTDERGPKLRLVGA